MSLTVIVTIWEFWSIRALVRVQFPSHPLRNDVVGGIQYGHCFRPDVRDFQTRLSFKEIVERNQASVLLEYDVLEYLPSTHSAILGTSASHLACR